MDSLNAHVYNKGMGHNRPIITQQHIEQIRQLMSEHPDWTRTRISKELCELWEWKSSVGQLKDISCRDLLRALEADGEIKLPPSKYTVHYKGNKGKKEKSAYDQLSLFDAHPEQIEMTLMEVLPIVVENADGKDKIGEFKDLVDRYHYLGYGQSVGECIRYIVRSRDGTTLACLMFGSSAWRCSSRDQFIGWSDDARVENLYFTSCNSRFVILKGIRIPHLASHILGHITRRISQDWQKKYGHPLYFLETFVERDRFSGTCYKAANWVRVGETAGLGRDSTPKSARLPVKDVYVYPLTKDFRNKLTEASGEGGVR
jgi:hypothetical protein